MSFEKVFEGIVKVIEEARPDLEGKIEKDSTFREGLGLDSLDMVSVYFELEDVFGIKIPEEDVSDKNLISMNAMIDYISKKINE